MRKALRRIMLPILLLAAGVAFGHFGGVSYILSLLNDPKVVEVSDKASEIAEDVAEKAEEMAGKAKEAVIDEAKADLKEEGNEALD